MDILIITGLILFTFIAILRLDWALFIVLAALPSYLIRWQIGPVPVTLLELMILISFVVWFIRDKPWQRYKKQDWKNRKQRYPYSLEIVGILIAAWAGLAIAGFDNSSLGILKAYFLEPIMLYIVILNRGQGSNKKYIWPLVISAAFISIIAIFQQITGLYIFNDFWAQLSQRRVTSVFAYPNAVGLYLAPIIFLIFGLLISYPKKTNLLTAGKKIILIITILTSLAAIVFARSEGALIAIAGASFIVAILANKHSRRIALSLMIIAIVATSLYSPAWNYLKQKATLMDLSGQIRRQQWAETMVMLNDDRIISGAGLNNYQETVAPFHQEGIFVKNDDPEFHRHVVWNAEYRAKVWQPVEIYLYPHNIFLNFWTEITLFGALLFMWLIARYYYDALRLLKTLDREKRNITLGLIGAMSAIVIHGLVDVPYFKNDLAIIFWLIIAILGIIKIKNKKTV
ncbi:MAG: O-antigen ligase family protein [Patescibacteria group bacterium]|nr:O-antigen ligase family protein [Patescibacteria group bacterium]